MEQVGHRPVEPPLPPIPRMEIPDSEFDEERERGFQMHGGYPPPPGPFMPHPMPQPYFPMYPPPPPPPPLPQAPVFYPGWYPQPPPPPEFLHSYYQPPPSSPEYFQPPNPGPVFPLENHPDGPSTSSVRHHPYLTGPESPCPVSPVDSGISTPRLRGQRLPPNPDLLLEERRNKQRQGNRESQQRSRDKKKAMIEGFQQKINSVHSMASDLYGALETLKIKQLQQNIKEEVERNQRMAREIMLLTQETELQSAEVRRRDALEQRSGDNDA